MKKVQRDAHKMVTVGMLVLSMSICLRASAAVGDSNGAVRFLQPGDSPNPWPFYDFRYGQYKSECISGGVGFALYAEGSAANPYGMYCSSPLPDLTPIRFYQSTTNVPFANETDEEFSTHDSADIGSHGIADWDAGFLKGECPAQSEIVGIAKTTDSSQQVNTIHCANNFAMCDSGAAFVPSNTCHPVAVATPAPSGLTVTSCEDGEFMVGVSVGFTHHPKTILCCSGVWIPCS